MRLYSVCLPRIISLSIKPSRDIHVVKNGTESYSIGCACVCSSVDRFFSCLGYCKTVNMGVFNEHSMNMGVYISFPVSAFIFVG